jgi:hypothetical protein
MGCTASKSADNSAGGSKVNLGNEPNGRNGLKILNHQPSECHALILILEAYV